MRPLRFVDAHCHLDDEAFCGDVEDVVGAFADDGVLFAVNASSDLPSSEATLDLTRRFDAVYGVVGVHPHEARTFRREHLTRYREMLGDPKILGVGECGLDYHYDFSPRETQKQVFAEMIELAEAEDVPLVIHSREAVRDTQEMLFSMRKGPTLIHCFTDAKEVAREYLARGYYLSIGGAVTFRNARHVVESVAYAPIEQLLLETDAPYMTPVPYRGKRNEPKRILETIRKIAEIKGMTPEAVAEATTRNARAFYRL